MAAPKTHARFSVKLNEDGGMHTKDGRSVKAEIDKENIWASDSLFFQTTKGTSMFPLVPNRMMAHKCGRYIQA
jgi:hypothetical protein